MSDRWDMSYLGVMADMAGCPNRCRHCWLGDHGNGAMTAGEFRDIVGEFKAWRDENGVGVRELGFFSWWREPDYRDDYRELYQIERELSSPGRAQRFELLSVWRLARDESYAEWAATLGPKACQMTFFGMEENTDRGTRRAGAFNDNLTATDRLLEAGLAPRWQLFVTKKNIGDLDRFTRLIYDLGLHRRCEAAGQKFEVFIGGISPEGRGYELEDIRVDGDDLARIPGELVSICREGTDMLGAPEHDLLDSLLREDSPPLVGANTPSVAVNAGYDVYPNIAEPAEWWRLGNLKTDGVDAVIRAYRDETTPGMRMNREMPVKELAKRYGDRNSRKLYARSDLICRFMHEWGVDRTEI